MAGERQAAVPIPVPERSAARAPCLERTLSLCLAATRQRDDVRKRLGDFAELGRFGQRAQLLQALILDLPDALAGDVERSPHLVERPRMLAVQPVAQLEHAPLAVRERPEDP